MFLLGAVGWSRRRILLWYESEALLGGGCIALAGIGSWLLGPRSSWGVLATLGLAILLPVSTIAATLLVLGPAGGRVPGAGDVWRGVPTGRVGGVVGIPSYAVRTLIARPVRSLTLVAALTVAAVAFSLGVVLVAQTAARVGPTLLASALTDTLRPYQLALLGLAGLGGCSLTLVLLGLDLADRRREFLILRAVGWSRRARLALVLAERAGLGLVSAALASILASLMAGPVLGAGGALPAALAAAGAGSVVVWGAGWRPPGEASG